MAVEILRHHRVNTLDQPQFIHHRGYQPQMVRAFYMVELHNWPGDTGQPDAQYKTGVRQIPSYTRHLSGSTAARACPVA